MTPIATTALHVVTGGAYPNARLEQLTLGEIGTRDLIDAAGRYGLQMPTKRQINKIKKQMLRDPRWGLEDFDHKANGGSSLLQFRDWQR